MWAAVGLRGLAGTKRAEVAARDAQDELLVVAHESRQEREGAVIEFHRDTAQRFADHAEWMVENLGDRVHTWSTLNEPVVASTFGYGFGTHAPGKVLMFDSFTATPHLLLGHSLAVQALSLIHISEPTRPY